MKLTRRSLTLIELLLVLMILAALAASAASFVEESDDQFRYQDTQNRLTSIREGILGRAAGGRSKRDGFVADLGRVPVSLSDLLVKPLADYPWSIDDGSDGELNELRGADRTTGVGGDPATGLGHGWRGPYLAAQPRLSDGTLSYPDGWGNTFVDTDLNFGWTWLVNGNDDIQVQSKGRGGVEDGPTPPADLYARDYPTTLPSGAINHLVERRQFVVPGKGMVLTATITNSASVPAEVRLRLRYFGRADASGVPTLQNEVSSNRRQIALLSGNVYTVPASGTVTVSFSFNLPNTPSLIPLGAKALDLVDGAPGEPSPTSGVMVGPGAISPLYTSLTKTQIYHYEFWPGASPAQTLPVTFRVGP